LGLEHAQEVLLNIHRDSLHPAFETGTLFIRGVLYKNKLPNNPNQFDYGEYLSKNKSMPSYTLTWIRSALVPYLKKTSGIMPRNYEQRLFKT
jgi:hypothetical protein